MARPHENPTLTTTCANPLCGKVISTEYPFSEGFIMEEVGQRRIVAVSAVPVSIRGGGHRATAGSEGPEHHRLRCGTDV